MSRSATDGFRLVYPAKGEVVARDFDQARVLIGRSRVCDVVIDAAEVARKHAEIVRDQGHWAVVALAAHAGTEVNRQPVTHQRLCDGDEIVLAPASVQPVAIKFQLVAREAQEQRSFLLDGSPERVRIHSEIDIEEFARSLSGVASGRTASLLADPQWALLRLFTRACDILLAAEGLEEMLQQVLDLAVDSLPGQRGLICLYDEKSGAVVPKAFREKAARDNRPFPVSRNLLDEAILARHAMLVDACDDPRFHEAVSVQQLGIRAAMSVPLYHAGQVRGVIYVDTRRAVDEFEVRDLETLTVLASLVALGMAQATLRDDVARERAIRARLSRYYSPRVVEQILSRGSQQDGEMLAEEREVSVLFADLADFTSIAEGIRPAGVIELLNAVFERLACAVFEEEGTLDKYIGDAVMAVFGAPVEQPDHACRAVACALQMRQLLDECNRQRAAQPALRMRIGVNSGRAIAGDVGSRLRKEYTVIGDVANIASRLQRSVAQPDEIVIGPATYEQVKDRFQCESLPEVQLRGKQQGLRPYRVLRAR